MKKLVLIMFVFINAMSVLAQNNAMEAKAAYLLAEEEFNAGKFEVALKYLDDATAKLGTANAKILYLKIMSLKALVEKDEKVTPKMQEAIYAFEKAPDVNDFNEEKQLEVMKLKLKLKDYVPPSRLEVVLDSVINLRGMRIGTPAEKLLSMWREYQAQIQPVVNNGKGELAVYQMQKSMTAYTTITLGLTNNKVSKISTTIPDLAYKYVKDTSSIKADSLLYNFLSRIDMISEKTESTNTTEVNGYNQNYKKIKFTLVQTIRTFTWVHNNIKTILTHTIDRKISKRFDVESCESQASVTVMQL